jgi:hypothetical protein
METALVAGRDAPEDSARPNGIRSLARHHTGWLVSKRRQLAGFETPIDTEEDLAMNLAN